MKRALQLQMKREQHRIRRELANHHVLRIEFDAAAARRLEGLHDDFELLADVAAPIETRGKRAERREHLCVFMEERHNALEVLRHDGGEEFIERMESLIGRL